MPMIESLSLCKNKKCDEETIIDCLKAEPVPHLSVLENCWFTFKVEGVSVKTRIQLERHRLFSTMERSTRHINMSEATTIVPSNAKNPELFEQAYSYAKYYYYYLLEREENIEDASYVLPLGVETKFTLSGNGRVWFEYLSKRMCKKYVQKEHYDLAIGLYSELIRYMSFFKYAIPCLNCKVDCKK